ncbi:MAG TPA: hypothetical protein VJ824_14300 [Bacillota bacterium]|nr:hypothetical protein [Bacillota bacterium]
MDEKQLDEAFTRLKQQLPVNQDLKKNLRQSILAKSPQKKWWQRMAYIGVIAAALIFMFMNITPERMMNKVQAASLKISNQQSFVELGVGNPNGVAEYNGTLYVPVAQQGLFSYNSQGFHKLLDGDFEQIRISEDGKKLLLSQAGSIELYNLEKKRIETLFKETSTSILYQHPAWKDNDHILFVKKDPQNSKAETEIFELDLKTSKETRITNGDFPSYVGDGALVLEREDQILYRNLKDGSEKKIDDGHSPSVSKNHQYVAYVKTELAQSNSTPANTFRMENVWIADLDFTSKKQVTTNIPQNDDLEQTLSTNEPAILGKYGYVQPSWNGKGDRLYVIKRLNGPNESTVSSRLMKIDLTPNKLTAEETVKRFIQALTVRDDDYAKSLMKNPPKYLTGSNPRCVGYKIISSGKLGEQEYVDADIYWSYTANPYYKVVKSRYFVSPSENGYLIDQVQDKSISEFNGFEKQTVKFIQDGKEQVLFSQKEIPASLLPEGNVRIASLAYREMANTLIVCLQIMKDQNQSAFVRLLQYNIHDRSFSLIGDLKELKNEANVGIAFASINPDEQILSLDLYSGGSGHTTFYTVLYTLDSQQMVMLSDKFIDTQIDKVRTDWWDGDDFIFEIQSHGQTLKYKYNKEKDLLEGW